MEEESRLIRRIQRTGNKTDADVLIRKYYDEIYIYVFKQTSDKEIAMDLTQEIFISVLKSINNYNRKLSGFRTWLYRIATNKTIDHLRRSNTGKTFLNVDELDIPDETEFSKQMGTKFIIHRLQAYVNTMEADKQQIFRLKYFAEYTFIEISGILSLPESTVKSKYYRMLKQIREEFRYEYSDAG